MRSARVTCLSLFAAAMVLCTGMGAQAGNQALIKMGDSFPTDQVQLSVDQEALAGYLGVPKGKRFAIKDIQADLVLVEIMNVYCASCWRQVPIYNELYELIESNPKLRDRIKVVAFGVGNKDWEVKYFREKFEVPFVVIPDPDFVMHAAIGGSKTAFSC